MMMAMMRIRSARCVGVRCASTSSAGSGGSSTSFYASNWLAEGCGDVPRAPRAVDFASSEMLRGGHALQVASASLLDGQLAGAERGGPTAFSAQHVETLKGLREVERRAGERFEQTVRAEGFRFRPSLVLPAVHCGSTIVGGLLSWFGEDVSSSFVAGVKLAIGDFYNDQIRELYEHQPQEQAIKDLFKATRDEELAFVDEIMPDVAEQYQNSSNTVATVARNTTKALLEVAKVV